VNLWRSSSLHPGWPMPVGPLRVPAGLVRLRPVRLRDAAPWSRIRLADRAHPGTVGTGDRCELGSAARGFVVAIGMLGVALGGTQGVGCFRTSSRVDGQFSGQLTIGNVTHGAPALGVDRILGGQLGKPVAGFATGRGGAGALTICFGPLGPAPRRGDGAPRERGEPGRAGKGRFFARKGCCGATSRWTAPGAITCWWPSRSRNSTARQRPRWCARATRAGPDCPAYRECTQGCDRSAATTLSAI